MRMPIDVLFLDRALRVVGVLSAIAPWRVSGIYLGAHSALELPAGTAEASDTREGDQLAIEPGSF
ncbi:MAG TPA: DUF192 domain-containing protein [Marmoricola sp.]|nr:DUF192 domain-containing protein [Marmoricola sp.]